LFLFHFDKKRFMPDDGAQGSGASATVAEPKTQTGTEVSKPNAGGSADGAGKQDGDRGAEYWKKVADEAIADRQKLKESLRERDAKEEQARIEQLAKNQEFEKLWQSEKAAREADKQLIDLGKRFIEQSKARADELKKH
jgi:murein L,D-transpeptidase YcbB/YkuD